MSGRRSDTDSPHHGGQAVARAAKNRPFPAQRKAARSMAKPTSIRSSEEFAHLLKALVDDIRFSHDCYQLYRKLGQASQEYTVEFCQTPAFWYVTRGALIDTAMLRLCRVYDQHNSANHLHGLLLTIKANPGIFEEAQFRERLKDNPHVDSLAKHGTVPDRFELERDLALTSVDDPDVSVLYKWRGSVVAHSNAEIAKGSKQWTKDNPLSSERIEKLIVRAYEIFNRYCVLFNATSYSKLLIGEGDYENLFKLLRLGLQQFQNGIG